MGDGEAEPQQACQLSLLIELVRELQTPRQNATTTQEMYSQKEQSQMEVAEAATGPEVEQSEADQMILKSLLALRHQLAILTMSGGRAKAD